MYKMKKILLGLVIALSLYASDNRSKCFYYTNSYTKEAERTHALSIGGNNIESVCMGVDRVVFAIKNADYNCKNEPEYPAFKDSLKERLNEYVKMQKDCKNIIGF
jgi:hypothetical protein